ncbi:hypothetical protein GOB86_13025 [Acetobacter lambici]|uniref:Uncharacterized protein n=1 Tax=Acetobacter lambici TaxID=1332824 RepID=A0ABT1F3F6_9PROT|nr:hypothetical protein [Acetobacter lambici]MCP1243706.1 hypothetical protein [Acetobacter lambici]MCP1259748.1 hypothetical protein [Acetobacter lambici]NHO57961.1 hypothetical protein [Acetobacter lambici]
MSKNTKEFVLWFSAFVIVGGIMWGGIDNPAQLSSATMGPICSGTSLHHYWNSAINKLFQLGSNNLSV